MNVLHGAHLEECNADRSEVACSCPVRFIVPPSKSFKKQRTTFRPPLRSIPTDALNAVEAMRPRREIPLGRLVASPGAQASARSAIAPQVLALR